MKPAISVYGSRVAEVQHKILHQLPEDVRRQWGVAIFADPAFLAVRAVFVNTRNASRRYDTRLHKDGAIPDEIVSLLCIG